MTAAGLGFFGLVGLAAWYHDKASKCPFVSCQLAISPKLSNVQQRSNSFDLENHNVRSQTVYVLLGACYNCIHGTLTPKPMLHAGASRISIQ